MAESKKLNFLRQKLSEAVELQGSSTYDPAFKLWLESSKAGLRRVFGNTSIEYKEFERISYYPMVLPADANYERESFESGIANAEAKLQSMITNMEYWEDDEAEGSTVANDPKGREGINPISTLHPKIRDGCVRLYSSNNYSEAVEKGFKIVRGRLRELTGFETGADAFGRGRIHVKGASEEHVDQDFNDGVKFLTMAIDKFRNEKSHSTDSEIHDPGRAYEYLVAASLAMHLLDGAETQSE